MNKILIGIKTIGGSVLTFFVYVLGGYDVALECILIAMAIDYLSGLSQAYYNSNVNSKVAFKGFLKKFGIILLICLSVILDKIAGSTGLIRTWVIYYCVATEGISITENLGKMNILVPQVIKDKLEQLKDKEGE